MGRQERKDSQVDEAVEMTFPASDPPAFGMETGTEPSRRPMDRQPPRITREEVEAAERDEGHRHLHSGSSRAKARRRKHRGVGSEGLHSGDEPQPTLVEDHGGLGQEGSAGRGGRSQKR